MCKAAYNFGKSYQLPGTTVLTSLTFLPGFKEGTNKITQVECTTKGAVYLHTLVSYSEILGAY